MANDLFGTVETDWYRTRLNRVLACILAGFFILASGLYYLQIIRGEELRRVAENNYVRLENIFPPRGLIYDRNGKLLVDNRPCFDVSIILEDAPDPENVMRRVALLLSMPETALLEKIKEINRSKPFKPILLKSDISRDELAVIKTRRFDLPGVVVSVEPRRHYVMGDYASHLIGYLGEISERELRNGSYPDNRGGDFIGKFGIEKTCNSYFWGKRGGRQVVVDAFGRKTDTLSTVDPKPGKTVYLSIDGRLQKVAEDMLRKKTAGAVLAMNPDNGHILAMASHPCFDQNALVEGMSYAEWETVVKDPLHPLENKGIQGQYPPGSIYKIVTAMAALEEGVVTEETTSYCPGFYRLGKSRFRCWKRHGHGLMTIREAMAESCDVFFYKAGEMVGVDRLAYYARGCGLGARTGIRLGNEAAGLVPTKDWKQRRFHSSWQKGETLVISIGQGYNLITPVQAVSLIAAVANGGVRYAPVIIKEIRDSDGRLIETTKSKIVGRLPASEETLAIIRRGLEDAVNTKSGTGWAVRLSGGVMAGKTGTAQVVRQEGDRSKKQEDIPFRYRDHAWFCAYGPTQAPRIAVAVLVEHGEHGSSAAGPIAAEIIKTYLELYP